MGPGLSLVLCLPKTPRRSGSSGRATPRSCCWLLAQASSARELAGGWPARRLPPTCSRRSGEEQCPLLLRGPELGEGRAAFHWDCEVGEAANPCPRSASLPRARQALLPSLLYCPVQDCITKALPKKSSRATSLRLAPLVKKDRNEVPSGGFQDLHLLVTRQKAAARGKRAASPRSCLRAGLPAARTEQGGSLHTPMSHPQPPNSAEICRFWACSQEKARAVSEEAAQH